MKKIHLLKLLPFLFLAQNVSVIFGSFSELEKGCINLRKDKSFNVSLSYPKSNGSTEKETIYINGDTTFSTIKKLKNADKGGYEKMHINVNVATSKQLWNVLCDSFNWSSKKLGKFKEFYPHEINLNHDSIQNKMTLAQYLAINKLSPYKVCAYKRGLKKVLMEEEYKKRKKALKRLEKKEKKEKLNNLLERKKREEALLKIQQWEQERKEEQQEKQKEEKRLEKKRLEIKKRLRKEYKERIKIKKRLRKEYKERIRERMDALRKERLRKEEKQKEEKRKDNRVIVIFIVGTTIIFCLLGLSKYLPENTSSAKDDNSNELDYDNDYDYDYGKY